MKKTLLLVSMFSFVLISCNQSDYKVKTEDEKALYALGTMMGGRFAALDLTGDELLALGQGLKDSATKKDPQIKAEDYQMKIQALFKKRMEASSNSALKEGVDFLAKFVKDGAKQTKSGLAYKMLKDGSGKNPKADDMVEVHYKGTLIDGTVFDSSYKRGKTVTFPLNRVIKGWTEGLQLVKEGGKVKLVIPSELGYGKNGAPPRIPGGATLVFEIELVKIKANPVAGSKPKMKKGKKFKKSKKK
ncbi:MAG: FKBP-type peptidyl-prolyl cis-trans isomerase [Bacteriovoracaceae bacterium]|nr:FKBP-type peptidyl-prolyl cis-trans isomerase [Bacteriovoracaceae bacterium]